MTTGGLSSRRLGRMREVMSGYVERDEIPGLVALISRRGELHVDAIGTLAREGGAAMQRDTIFRISSMTKPITAAAAMILVEECRLRLDDPVDDLLPELASRRVLIAAEGSLDATEPARRAITLRDLLTFTFGFGQMMAMPDAYPILVAANAAQIGMAGPQPDAMPEPNEWIRRLGDLPLMYQPGERWMYNTGSDVLGVLIARAANQPFDAFLEERIFRPLGMTDTAFFVPADKLDRFATEYWTDGQTGAPAVLDAPGGQWSHAPAFPSGAAGLVSTVDDYLAFGQMMLNGGRHGHRRILSRPSVTTMTTDQLSAEQKSVSGLVDGYFESHGWGLGMAVTTRTEAPGDHAGKFGWDGGFGTSWYSDPTEDLVGILMTQMAWSSPSPPKAFRDFWTLAYAAIDD